MKHVTKIVLLSWPTHYDVTNLVTFFSLLDSEVGFEVASRVGKTPGNVVRVTVKHVWSVSVVVGHVWNAAVTKVHFPSEPLNNGLM